MINVFIKKVLDDTKKCKDRYLLFQSLMQKPDIFKHSINVMIYSLMIGKEIRLDDSEMVQLGAAALLHDIGKLEVPSAVLNKSTNLSEEEFSLIKKHSLLGYQTLNKIDDKMNPLLSIVALQHHERNDGSGYPYGLMDLEIHPFSKIVAVADVYDALTEVRVYRQITYSSEEAMNMIKKSSGLQFEEKYCSAFNTSLMVNSFKTDPSKFLLRFSEQPLTENQ